MQAAGGVMTSSTTASTVLLGLHIYMGGIGLQQVFILVFVGLAGRFQGKAGGAAGAARGADWRRLLYALYAALGLITVSGCGG